MHNKPTNNETNIIRGIFAQSMNSQPSVPAPTEQINEGWMDAIINVAKGIGKAAEKGATKAGKRVPKTPENIPGVKAGKMGKEELPNIMDRLPSITPGMPKPQTGMGTGMKVGAGLVAGTMAVGSAVAPFMGGQPEVKEIKAPAPKQGMNLQVPAPKPVAKSSFSDVAKAHGYDIPNTTEPAKMPTTVPSGPISQDELTAMGLGNKPSVVDTAKNIMTKVARPQPAPQPSTKLPEQPMDRAVQNYKSTQPPAELPSTTTPAAKPSVSDDDLVKIVPGSQSWGGLSSEQQKKIASHYAAGKTSLSIRHKGGKFDEAGYGDQGQYGDIVKALNKVQMQESYYNRLTNKLDEAMGIQQAAYGFTPKGASKVRRLANRYEQEPMASWSGDSTVEAPDLEPESKERPHIDDVVAPHISTLIAAADKAQVDLSHGEAFNPRSKDHQKLLKMSKDPAVVKASQSIGQIRKDYGIED
jgi:hypothetical protein